MFANGDLCKGVNGNKGVAHQLGCNPSWIYLVLCWEGKPLGAWQQWQFISINYNMPRGGALSNMFYMEWNKVKRAWKETNVFLWLMKHGKANSFHASIWLCWMMEKMAGKKGA